MRKPGVLLVLTLALALALPLTGCIGGSDKKEEPTAPTGSTPTTPTGPTGSTPPTSPTGPGNGTTPGPKPQDVNLSDAKESTDLPRDYTFKVEAATFAMFSVKIDFAGPQKNTVPNGFANVIVTLTDSNNTVVKKEVKSGPTPLKVDWTFTAADVKSVGDWKLNIKADTTAAPAQPPASPPAGLFSYKMTTMVMY